LSSALLAAVLGRSEGAWEQRQFKRCVEWCSGVRRC
jgi:hypothetical protein